MGRDEKRGPRGDGLGVGGLFGGGVVVVDGVGGGFVDPFVPLVNFIPLLFGAGVVNIGEVFAPSESIRFNAFYGE